MNTAQRLAAIADEATQLIEMQRAEVEKPVEDQNHAAFNRREAQLEKLAHERVRIERLEKLSRDPRHLVDGVDLTVEEPMSKNVRANFRGDPFEGIGWKETPESMRSRALTAVEQWPADDQLKTGATKVLENGVDRTSLETIGIAEHVLRTSNPHYLSAFRAFMRDPIGFRDILSDAERGAWAGVREMQTRAALDLTGAVLPAPLDPSIVLANAGTLDPMRSVARVDQTIANTKKFITSAGVTASFDAELTEVSDDTPTLAEPEITCRKAQAFVQASIEAAMDQPDFSAEVAMMFADAKARLEGDMFIRGVAGSNQPIGIETALAGGSSEINSAGEALVGDDVYGLIGVSSGPRPASRSIQSILSSPDDSPHCGRESATW